MLFYLKNEVDVGSSIFICVAEWKRVENGWRWNVWKLEEWKVGVDQVLLKMKLDVDQLFFYFIKKNVDFIFGHFK